MSVSPIHLLEQGSVITSLLRTLCRAAHQTSKRGKRTGKDASDVLGALPGPLLTEVVRPRSRRLVADYVRHVGGDPEAYRSILPFHFFPQWAVPILSRTLRDLPYNLVRIVNAGCCIRIDHPLPSNAPLHLQARLERVDASAQRAIITQRLITDTPQHPRALVVEQTSLVALQRGSGSRKKSKPQSLVPAAVRELGRFYAHGRCGLEFAMLTGDINPLHWLGPYARAAGHPRPIQHGFSTLARTVEILNRNLWHGDVRRLRALQVRFTRPLPVASEATVFINEQQDLYVGTAPGEPAFVMGRFAAVGDPTNADGFLDTPAA